MYFKFLQCMTAGSSGMSLDKRMFIWLQISYLKFFIRYVLPPPSSIIK